MRSWSKYGEKNGKAGNAAFGFLGRERTGSSLRPSGHYASGHRTEQELRRNRLVGNPCRDCKRLARLVRMKQLDFGDWAKARKLAKDLADSWSLIQPSNVLRSKAVQLVERYDLRGADSLQLAAALSWCEDVPQGGVFLTADQKLREAALLSGFDAKEI
ncbi:MAG TPA: type II toxin-antitoxin system VapC family toxin [Terriglobales bacterium]|jgi:hypothetical protein|nr:type II toxin-antitoxin system VapC family toxin [Terriglobales bacterium]